MVEYKRITYDLTLSLANTLVQLNPDTVFTFASGVGTDSSEKEEVCGTLKELGNSMIHATLNGYEKKVLECVDIRKTGR